MSRFLSPVTSGRHRGLEDPLCMIMGLPGVGKTSLARALCGRIGGQIVTTEEVRAKLFDRHLDKGDRDFTPDELSITYRAVNLLASYLLTTGTAVIVDGVFRSECQRNALHDVVIKRGRGFLGIHLTCNDVVVRQRLIERQRKGSISPAGVSAYEALKTQFDDVPTHYLTIDTSQGNLRSLVDDILTWCMGEVACQLKDT